LLARGKKIGVLTAEGAERIPNLYGLGVSMVKKQVTESGRSGTGEIDISRSGELSRLVH
jgi:hypothetical protein